MSAVPEIERCEEESVDAASSRRVVLTAAAAMGTFASVPLVGRFLRLGDALASKPKPLDVKVLQLALHIEYTEVAFYEQALEQAGLKGDLRVFAHTALGHERQHRAAIKKALGADVLPEPRFEFGRKTKNANAFARAAIELEDIAVGAYNGQAANVSKATLAVAATIVSVEARHAAWVRAIVGQVAAPDPVDQPLTARQAAAGLHRIGLRT